MDICAIQSHSRKSHLEIIGKYTIPDIVGRLADTLIASDLLTIYLPNSSVGWDI